MTRSGQDQYPGNAYAVLYSLQKMSGRFCDFKTFRDTEVNKYLFKYYYL